MYHYLVLCLIYALSVLLASRVVPGLRVQSYFRAVVFAIVLGILDLLLFRLLVVLTLPFLFLTFGFSLLVLHALLFWMANRIVSGVTVDGFGTALIASALTGLIHVTLTYLLLGKGSLFGF